MKTLENDKEIIVNESDKGGNIVILKRDQYITMCNRLLNEETCYEILPPDPTKNFQKELVDILEVAERNKVILISKSTFSQGGDNP